MLVKVFDGKLSSTVFSRGRIYGYLRSMRTGHIIDKDTLLERKKYQLTYLLLVFNVSCQISSLKIGVSKSKLDGFLCLSKHHIAEGTILTSIVVLKRSYRKVFNAVKARTQWCSK